MWAVMRESSAAPDPQVPFPPKAPLEAHTDPLCHLDLRYNDELDLWSGFPSAQHKLWHLFNSITKNG